MLVHVSPLALEPLDRPVYLHSKQDCWCSCASRSQLCKVLKQILTMVYILLLAIRTYIVN